MSRPLSLRNRLIPPAAACMLPLLLVVGVILETLDAGRDQVLDAQAATAEVAASMLGSVLDENRKVLQELASIDRIRPWRRRRRPTRSTSSTAPAPISTGSSRSM